MITSDLRHFRGHQLCKHEKPWSPATMPLSLLMIRALTCWFGYGGLACRGVATLAAQRIVAGRSHVGRWGTRQDQLKLSGIVADDHDLSCLHSW
jgi:hypothetical protein